MQSKYAKLTNKHVKLTNSLGCSSPVIFINVLTEFVHELFKAQINLQEPHNHI